MPTISYTILDGVIVSENRAGVKRDYMRDSLGSTVALLDNAQAQSDTFFYWPYGEIRTQTGTTKTPFTFVGTLGYYMDIASPLFYVRMRHLRSLLARWLTVDPYWPDQQPYAYVAGQPICDVDPTGTSLKVCTISHNWAYLLGVYGAAECKANTAAYASQPGLFSACASCVSATICDAIAALNACAAGGTFDGYTISLSAQLCKELAEGLVCQNDCMAAYWARKGTAAWKRAQAVCRTYGNDSSACCKASVSAEQQVYTMCNTQCGLTGALLAQLPEWARVQFGDSLCC